MYSSYSSVNSIILKGSKPPASTLQLLTSVSIGTGYLVGIISNNGLNICWSKAGGNNAVYYSSNGGSTWGTSSGLTISNDFTIMSSDSTGQYILLCSSTANTKPYYSTNFGASFSQLSASPTNSNGWWGCYVGEIDSGLGYPSVLCWGCQTALYTSNNNGSSISSNKISTFKFNSMAGAGNFIALSQDTNSNTNNIVISSNASTFSLFSPQITASPTFYGRDVAIGYSPTNGLKILYAGISTNSTYLYNGTSWSSLSGAGLFSGLDFASGCDMSDSGKAMYIIDKTNRRLYYSLDYGSTWANISSINSAFSSNLMYGCMSSSNGKYAIIGQLSATQLILLTHLEEN